ncbi:MAG: tetratricopeptide repeat protein [Candidatus Omnitrophota bacterium]
MLKRCSFDAAGRVKNNMKKRIVVTAFVMLAALSIFLCRQAASSEETFFASGNREYEKGDYSRAIAEYEKARFSDKVSAALYYNLAGAYFKSGDVGRAVLNYERALRLAPRDPDIAANYAFARSMVTGKEPLKRGFFAWRPVRLYSGFFTVNEITAMTSGLFFLLFVIIAAAVVSERSRAIARGAAIFLTVIIVFNSAIIFHKVKDERSYAVTVVPSLDVLFGPFDSATKFFTLHEGNGVTILETKDLWYRVRRPDGMAGWVRQSGIERI